jgi:hypothetical protein
VKNDVNGRAAISQTTVTKNTCCNDAQGAEQAGQQVEEQAHRVSAKSRSLRDDALLPLICPTRQAIFL